MKKRFCFKSILFLVFVLPLFAFTLLNLCDMSFIHNKTSYAAPNDIMAYDVGAEQVSDKASLDAALEKVNSSRFDAPITINFDLTLDDAGGFDEKTIVLTRGYAIFTGTIVSDSAEPIFKFSPTVSDNSFVLNLELKSTAPGNKDRAVSFENGNNTLKANIKLGENLKTDYEYLCNFASWVNMSVEDEASFAPDATPLKIVYPYNLGRFNVIQNYSSQLASVFEIVSENEELYSVKKYTDNGALSAEAEINIKFVNNAETEDVKATTFRYNNAYFTFPAAEEYAYEHHTFGGWFAKIELDQTYYIEHTTESVNALLTNETTTLKTSLDEVDSENCFSLYSVNQDELCRKVVDFFLENGKVPTFELLWVENEYTVSFDAGDGSFEGGEQSFASSGKFGEDIVYPDAPTRYGYEFGGWVDEHETSFEQSAHPAFDDNHALHAVWTAKQYSIDFYSEPGALFSSLDFTFGEEITYPSGLEKTGYTFGGVWLTEDEEVFDATTMLDDYVKGQDNITKISLFAKWNINRYKLNLWYGDTLIASLEFDFDTPITANMLTQPNAIVGYVFEQYYMDPELETAFAPFNLSRNTSLYAKFNLTYHKAYYCLGYNDNQQVIYDVGYNRNIPFLVNPTRTNFKFVGWFTDEALTLPFASGTRMGTEDVYIYAKWQAKQQVQIDTTPRSFTVFDLNTAFDNFSQLDGFTVEYLDNGTWKNWVPSVVGAYDVRITRAEDEEYASFEVVLKNALIVEPQYLNITWLIVVLLIVFVVEMLVCVLLKVMKKLKANLSLSVAFLPFMSMFFDKQSGDLFVSSTQAITLTQFILLMISAFLVLLGFVLMIIFIYRLHRTAPALIYENVHDESEGLGETPNVPQDTANDEQIKSKIDSYLSGFVTDKKGYVNGRDDQSDVAENSTDEPAASPDQADEIADVDTPETREFGDKHDE